MGGKQTFSLDLAKERKMPVALFSSRARSSRRFLGLVLRRGERVSDGQGLHPQIRHWVARLCSPMGGKRTSVFDDCATGPRVRHPDVDDQ
jgi:hypothetical protein